MKTAIKYALLGASIALVILFMEKRIESNCMEIGEKLNANVSFVKGSCFSVSNNGVVTKI